MTGFQFSSDFVDQIFGFIPADAAVGDRLSVGVFVPGLEALAAFGDIAFEHYAGNFWGIVEEEFRSVDGVGSLFAIVFVGVRVRAIDHNGAFER